MERALIIILLVCICILIVGNDVIAKAKSEVIDILSLPGWERRGTADLKAKVKYDKDDKILRITNPDCYSYSVENFNVSLKAEKPFEVKIKIETKGISHTKNIQLGFARLYNLQQMSWLEVGLGTEYPSIDFNFLYFNLINLKKPERERFLPIIQRNERIVVPQGIVLGIKVEDDSDGLGEKITIYNCGTGEIFKQTNLPYIFFKNKMFFGFESRNITNDPQGVQMEIEHFSVVFPGREAKKYLSIKK